MDRLGLKLPDAPEAQPDAALYFHQLPAVLRYDAGFFLPRHFERIVGPVGSVAAQPAGALGGHAGEPSRFVRLVPQALGMDFVRALPQHRFAIVFQQNLSVDQVVPQQLPPRLDPLARRRHRDGVARGLDALRHEVHRRRRFALGGWHEPHGTAVGGLFRRVAIDEVDRQPFAIESIVRALGVQPEHLNLLLERGDFARYVEAKRSLAGDFDRLVGDIVGCGVRRSGIALGGGGAGGSARGNLPHLKVQPLNVSQFEGLDSGHAGRGLPLGRLAFEQLDAQVASSAEVRPEPKIDGVRGSHFAARHFEVAGDDEQVVFGAGRLALAANGNASLQLAADDLPDVGASKVERTVELEDRALGRFENHRASPARGFVFRRSLGGNDDGAGAQLQAAVAQVAVVLHEKLELVAFENLGIPQRPGIGREQFGQRGNAGVDLVRGVPPPLGIRLHLGASRGGWFDQRNGHGRVHPVHRHDDQAAYRDASDARHAIACSGTPWLG